MSEQDPFFVGYHPVAPAALARKTRHGALLLGGLALGMGLLLAWSEPPAAPGSFEFGTTTTLFGQLHEFPYPMLLVPGGEDPALRYTRYLLVRAGKFGAQATTLGRDGEWVTVQGYRILRGDRRMLEIRPGTMIATAPDSNVRLGIPVPAPEPLGRLRFRGEVVDSKCWLGVMKPATGNVHRGCAARCLSGGIPPLLMTTDSTGAMIHLLLTGPHGEPAHERFKALVGRTLTLTGDVRREGDLLVMAVAEVEGE